MSDHVKLKEEEVEGHDADSVKKHLTMKYNMKDLKKFTAFEAWVTESLEDLIPDESKRPEIEATSLMGLSDEKKAKALKKLLGGIRDSAARDDFIGEYINRFSALPTELLDAM